MTPKETLGLFLRFEEDTSSLQGFCFASGTARVYNASSASAKPRLRRVWESDGPGEYADIVISYLEREPVISQRSCRELLGSNVWVGPTGCSLCPAQPKLLPKPPPEGLGSSVCSCSRSCAFSSPQLQVLKEEQGKETAVVAPADCSRVLPKKGRVYVSPDK